MSTSEMKTILATDCGSTTTKAILIKKQGNEYRLVARGEAPTTVEAPFEDVMVGVMNSFNEVEELTESRFLTSEGLLKPARGDREGVDVYVSTSSAGGGLQMLVAGVVKEMTAESAERAALGAGAIVMDVLAINDGRLPHQKVDLIRRLRPDMILLSGGTDGGDMTHVVGMAEIIRAARPRARLGLQFKLPVIYAGNKNARDKIREILGDEFVLHIVDNLRPVLERENLMPARLMIQEMFLEHVMSHAPGYKRLMEWTDAPIMPTPAAVGKLIQMIGEQRGITVIGVDIGGATTDVFSYFQKVFNRTVSANYGMSYSVSNVLADAGLENISRWVPFSFDPDQLRNAVKNKMIRPTTIPATLEALMIEHAIAREALRMSFAQHLSLAVGLKGIQQQRTIAEAFEQTRTGESLINMMDLDLFVGSGGILSHAPRRSQAAMMIMDSFQPEGFTQLAVDSIFMMPHLGVLSEINPEAASQVFDRDCLIHLGPLVAPRGPGEPGEPCLKLTIDRLNGHQEEISFKAGEVRVLPLPLGESAKVLAHPSRRYDMGAGPGKPVSREVHGGVVGLMVDCRGRPLRLPDKLEERARRLNEWFTAFHLYPPHSLKEVASGGARVHARS
ncbi:MAG: glutamate mutase L [bacterium JZ-2024 1]